jgi:hypothetical protein
MKLFIIEQTVRYVAEIEAETEEEAMEEYYDNQGMYYWNLDEESISSEDILDDDE